MLRLPLHGESPSIPDGRKEFVMGVPEIHPTHHHAQKGRRALKAGQAVETLSIVFFIALGIAMLVGLLTAAGAHY